MASADAGTTQALGATMDGKTKENTVEA